MILNWHQTHPTIQTWALCDKYEWRLIDILANRVEACVFFLETCVVSETLAFWYDQYAAPNDAIKAAKYWAQNRGMLEYPCEDLGKVHLAPGVYRDEPTRMHEGKGY